MKSAKTNIVLIGMPGSGKTLVGKELSKLGFDFIDTDEIIIQKFQKQISDIFKEYGENFFRDVETQTLKDCMINTGLIISTGGGIVEKEENINIIKKNAFCVYLKTSENTLYERLKTSTNRPLLKSENETELQNKIHKLFEKRSTKYEFADETVVTDEKNETEIANEIIERYKAWTKLK